MKVRYTLPIVLCSTLLLASCTDKIESAESSNAKFTIVAEICQPGLDTKTDLGEKEGEGYPVLWEDMDVIGVNTAQTGTPVFSAYTLNSGANTRYATFAGEQEPVKYYDIQQVFLASYPQTPSEVSVSGNDHNIVMSYEVSDSQTHVKGRNLAKGTFPMVGYSKGYGNLMFENLASVIRVNLKGDYTVKNIKIKPTDEGSGFAGSVKASINDVAKEPTLSSEPVTGSSVTLDCSSDPVALDAENLTSFDFVVCPGTFMGGLVCTVTKSNGETVTKNYNQDVELRRSCMLEIGDDGTRFNVYLESPLDSTDCGQTSSAKDLECIVTSYKVKDGVKTALGWTAEYSEDGGLTWHSDGVPTDYEALGLEGAGSTDGPVKAEFELKIQSYSTESDADNTNHWTTALRDKGTAATTIDLSQRDAFGNSCDVTTSNCYVVSQAGTYTFPALYGNVEKAGAINTAAFTSQATGSGILNPFTGPDGGVLKSNNAKTAITSITELKKLTIPNAKKVSLIWTDHSGLIKETDDKGKEAITLKNNMITFSTCDAENIHSGNAVIAVTDDNGNILWSWHIWVTDQDLTKTMATNGVKMLPCNLGWYSTGAYVFKRSSVMVKYTQAESGKTVIIGPVVRPEIVIPVGSNVLYQWGRMNPLAGNCSSVTSTSPLTEIFTNPVAAIAYNTTTYDTNGSLNRWNADNDIIYNGSNDPAASVVKTVYDPCPNGLSIPKGNAFSDIADNYVILQGADLNDNVNDFGGFCLEDDDNNIQFFPLGARDFSGTDILNKAVYWTASPAYYGGTSGALSSVAYKIVKGSYWQGTPMSYDNYVIDLGAVRPMVEGN